MTRVREVTPLPRRRSDGRGGKVAACGTVPARDPPPRPAVPRPALRRGTWGARVSPRARPRSAAAGTWGELEAALGKAGGPRCCGSLSCSRPEDRGPRQRAEVPGAGGVVLDTRLFFCARSRQPPGSPQDLFRHRGFVLSSKPTGDLQRAAFSSVSLGTCPPQTLLLRL